MRSVRFAVREKPSRASLPPSAGLPARSPRKGNPRRARPMGRTEILDWLDKYRGPLRRN
jgi:hypothetical protein